jgi:biotin carboxyl carrier protein
MKYVVDVNNVRHDVELDGVSATIGGVDGKAELGPSNGTPVRIVRIGDTIVRVTSRRGERKGVYTLEIDGYKYEVEAIDERTRAIRDMTAKAAGPAGPAPLKAPMPGLIVRVNVKVGDVVQVGQGLVVMEAMKMENELRSTASGTVKAVLATPGTAVEKGALLVELE